MKVVVFGGAGFLGSHVADVLTDAGFNVVVFDRIKSLYLRPQHEMVVGDILDEGMVADAVKGCDVVYNFAGISGVDSAHYSDREKIANKGIRQEYIFRIS